MRTLLVLIGLLFVMPQISLAEKDQGKCREGYSLQSTEFSLIDQMRHDLLNGLWTYQFDGGEQTFQFNSDGLVDILQKNIRGEIQHVEATWRLEEFSGHAFLALKPNFSKEEKLYQLKATCEGMDLTNVISNETKQLMYKQRVAADFYDQVQNILVGSWRSISYPFTLTADASDCGTVAPIKDAFLEYTFEENGMYTMRMGAGAYEVSESGTWELSKDAGHLIFQPHTAINGGRNNHRVASVNMLEFHEMVIGQKISSDITDREFCSEWKAFSFHKLSI